MVRGQQYVDRRIGMYSWDKYIPKDVKRMCNGDFRGHESLGVSRSLRESWPWPWSLPGCRSPGSLQTMNDRVRGQGAPRRGLETQGYANQVRNFRGNLPCVEWYQLGLPSVPGPFQICFFCVLGLSNHFSQGMAVAERKSPPLL